MTETQRSRVSFMLSTAAVRMLAEMTDGVCFKHALIERLIRDAHQVGGVAPSPVMPSLSFIEPDASPQPGFDQAMRNLERMCS